MKLTSTQHPEFCNVETGLCVIPVQFIETVEIKDVHLSNECF